MANDGALTVSTHCSISRKNFELAPKALKMVTPAMVSLYMEYKGERVTESDNNFRIKVEAYMRCDLPSRRKSLLHCPYTLPTKVRLSQNVSTPKNNMIKVPL